MTKISEDQEQLLRDYVQRGENHNYGVLYASLKKGDYLQHHSGGCYGGLSSEIKGNIIGFAVNHKWGSSSQIAVRSKKYAGYIDHHFDPLLSPYRSILHAVSKVTDKDGNYEGIVVVDTDIDIRVVMNMVMSLREIYMSYNIPEGFTRLVAAGFKPEHAFFIAQYYSVGDYAFGGDVKVTEMGVNTYPGATASHSFSHSYLFRGDIDAILNGTPGVNNGGWNSERHLSSYRKYYPNSQIWESGRSMPPARRVEYTYIGFDSARPTKGTTNFLPVKDFVKFYEDNYGHNPLA